MDLSQLTATSTASTSGTQAAQGHHHHHRKSVSDQVSEMSSAISSAVQSGQLTSSQATSLQNELNSITQTLASAQNPASATATSSSSTTASSTSATSTSSGQGGLSQLSSADRQKVMQELHDVKKQLFQDLNPQSTSSTSAASSASQINSLFSAMDTNGDGTISKSELTNFLSQLSSSPQGAADLLIGSYYNPQGGLSVAASSAVGSSINVTA